MLELAFLIGVYSYSIFFLGLCHLLYKESIYLVTAFFLILIFFFYQRQLKKGFFKKIHFKSIRTILLFILFAQILVNLFGSLAPELSFDALWYHLTLPKLYLTNHAIFHIPGGLLYYSDMPKLTEMLYIPALVFQGEIVAKLIHFSFGLLTLGVLYQLSRKFFSATESLVACLIFYSNPVIAWESTVANSDLSWAFFETTALLFFVIWLKTNFFKPLIAASVMSGFAITTKPLAIFSLGIFIVLLIVNSYFEKNDYKILSKRIFLYTGIALLVPLPWFIFSYFNTGNPLYPFFTPILNNAIGPLITAQTFNPFRFVGDLWNLFTRASDPISPIYLMFLPLAFFCFKKFGNALKITFFYSLLSLISWYLMPRTGGGRFIAPYLGGLSIISYAAINFLKTRYSGLYIFSLGMIFLIAGASIGYRLLAELKYMPYFIGKQTKDEFLTQHLNFSFGDFYDTDGFFRKNIKSKDKVLLYGFHNLYYVDFPFIDSSWVRKGDKFNYIATQNGELPKEYVSAKLIYYNDKTHVKLYRL